MHKVIKQIVLIGLVIAGMVIGGNGLTESAAASSWHKGTPKIMRGTWYVPKKGAIKVSKNSYAFFYISYSKKHHAYYVMPTSSDGIKKVKYQYLGAHKYRVRGKITGGSEASNVGKTSTRIFKVTKKHLNSGTGHWNKKRPHHMISSKKVFE